MANPTIQRRRLGMALKRAREEAGKTQDEAAAVIDSAASKISRLEQGQSSLRQTDLNLLCEFYGVGVQDAAMMRELAKVGRQRGRWSTYRDTLPMWFRQYADLEDEASEIRSYQAEIIPGMLQAEGYMRQLFNTSTPSCTEQEAARHIEVRAGRQRLLDRQDIQHSFIISESAIRRVIGDPVTMHDQLAHLVKLSSRPNIVLQVLPFDAQTYAAASFNFTILRFADAASDVIYVESYTGADYHDGPDAVRAYERLWSAQSSAALGTVESRKLIGRIADDWGTHLT